MNKHSRHSLTAVFETSGCLLDFDSWYVGSWWQSGIKARSKHMGLARTAPRRLAFRVDKPKLGTRTAVVLEYIALLHCVLCFACLWDAHLLCVALWQHRVAICAELRSDSCSCACCASQFIGVQSITSFLILSFFRRLFLSHLAFATYPCTVTFCPEIGTAVLLAV